LNFSTNLKGLIFFPRFFGENHSAPGIKRKNKIGPLAIRMQAEVFQQVINVAGVSLALFASLPKLTVISRDC
jgi:hypothetical protein